MAASYTNLFAGVFLLFSMMLLNEAIPASSVAEHFAVLRGSPYPNGRASRRSKLQARSLEKAELYTSRV